MVGRRSTLISRDRLDIWMNALGQCLPRLKNRLVNHWLQLSQNRMLPMTYSGLRNNTQPQNRRSTIWVQAQLWPHLPHSRQCAEPFNCECKQRSCGIVQGTGL